jgi:RNA polymerase subunit RPABC4/transcription elongation factor Spt4
MSEQEQAKQECCPHCGKDMIKADLPYCQACGITDSCCPTCREFMPPNRKVCPQCGTDVGKK